MKPELPEARYDEFATWYAERSAAGTWVDATILANIEPLIGAIDSLTILDLCCGEGRFARQMSALGARVTGVDLSANLLEIARSSDPDASVTWLQDDARSLDLLKDDQFQGAICLMALMDIAELASVLQAVRRVVQPGGWFVAVLTHP